MKQNVKNNKGYEENNFRKLSLEYVYINIFSPRESAILSILVISYVIQVQLSLIFRFIVF